MWRKIARVERCLRVEKASLAVRVITGPVPWHREVNRVESKLKSDSGASAFWATRFRHIPLHCKLSGSGPAREKPVFSLAAGTRVGTVGGSLNCYHHHGTVFPRLKPGQGLVNARRRTTAMTLASVFSPSTYHRPPPGLTASAPRPRSPNNTPPIALPVLYTT